MKKHSLNWKKLLLIPILCMALVLTAGCGGNRASGDAQTRQDVQEEKDREEQSGETDGTDQADRKEQGSGEEDGTGSVADDDSGGGSDGQKSGAQIDRNGVYTTAEDVALYLHTYGRLPVNFMTKKEARSKGWSGGSLEEHAPGMCIGGDRFGNYEGILPDGSYHECDINTLGAEKRGAERLVYSDDGRIYYTGDHYESFTLLYGAE